jgi:hypothetical protein
MIVILDSNTLGILAKPERSGQQVIVATTNLKHLSIFCEAANWQDIKT